MALMDVFLAFAAEVTKDNAAKNAVIESLKTENAQVKEQLAIALSNDAADAKTIADAQTAAQEAQAALAAFKESVANGEENKKLEQAIVDLAANLGLPSPVTPVEDIPASA